MKDFAIDEIRFLKHSVMMRRIQCEKVLDSISSLGFDYDDSFLISSIEQEISNCDSIYDKLDGLWMYLLMSE